MRDEPGLLSLPPLSLYVHLPWCVKKCPYCDFNSHAVTGVIPAEEYIDALLADLENDLPLVWGRTVQTVFFGGGTPSLFTARQFSTLLDGVRSRVPLAPAAEITLEANPGTVERDSFTAYREAGINRVSLGVQSFDDAALERLGRIHGRAEAEQAIAAVHDAGLATFNVDLMYGLPGQTVEQAARDVQTALDLGAPHVSHYQLTLEPNTQFFARPPRLPDDERCWEMQQGCAGRLAGAGLEQYEISAWALPGHRCRHNINYWRYGDYLGIGAGAHGKLTLPAQDEIRRMSKQRHPRAYLQARDSHGWLAESTAVGPDDRVFEFFLNQLRLREGVHVSDLAPRTGLAQSAVAGRVDQAVARGLLRRQGGRWVPTDLGWRFLNDLQALFLPEDDAASP